MTQQESSEAKGFPTDIGKALMVMRVVWGALIMGQLAFLGVETILLSNKDVVRRPVDPQQVKILVIVNVVMLLTAIPVTYLVRSALFRKKRVDGVLPAQAYASGNLIFWAGCEGVSFFGLVVALIIGTFWPTILVVGTAMLLQIITYPKREFLESPGGVTRIQ